MPIMYALSWLFLLGWTGALGTPVFSVPYFGTSNGEAEGSFGIYFT